MKIIFMGTSNFAVPALKSLVESKHEIMAVYTKPPSQSGRNKQISKSAVHLAANYYGLEVLTPETFKTQSNIEQFLSINADIAVVASYGLILRKEILEAPKYGCINLHPSDLPRWRGAAPIKRSIMAGDTKTAICVMKMDRGLDTGDIIIKQTIPIEEAVTGQELHNLMAEQASRLLLKALTMLEDNKVNYQKQSLDNILYAEKISRLEEKINWLQEARLVNCQIRALSPKPGAYFTYNGELIKIIVADYENIDSSAEAGTTIDNNLTIACKGGILKPKLLQRQGRKMIYTDAFLRGFPIQQGARLNEN